MARSKYRRRSDGRRESTIKIDGKVIHVYGYTDDEIDRKKTELLISVHDGTLYVDKVTTFHQWAYKWLELIRPNRSINTMKMYDHAVDMLDEIIGKYPLSSLRSSDLQLALNKYADAPRTQEVLYITLNQIYNKAIAEEMLTKNPCEKLEKVKYKAPEKRSLTELEKEAFEKADLYIEDKLFLSLLYYCGLRRGEALALTRSQFDLKHWTLKIDAAVVFETNSKTIRKPMPKTAAGFRTLPIPTIIRPLLTEYLEELPGIYLFTKQDGSLITHNAYVHIWNRILVALNASVGGINIFDKKQRKTVMQINVLPGLTAHVFRHNYCTMLYYAGVPIKDAQYLMGHANPMTTLAIYTHLDKLNSSSASLLDQYLTDKKEEKTDDFLTNNRAKKTS